MAAFTEPKSVRAVVVTIGDILYLISWSGMRTSSKAGFSFHPRTHQCQPVGQQSGGSGWSKYCYGSPSEECQDSRPGWPCENHLEDLRISAGLCLFECF